MILSIKVSSELFTPTLLSKEVPSLNSTDGKLTESYKLLKKLLHFRQLSQVFVQVTSNSKILMATV